MASRKSHTNYYTELIIFSAAVGAEAILLSLFHIGQPLVGYTLILLTTCIGAIVCGKNGGLIIGLIGGIASFCCGFSAGVFAAPAIYQLLITCIPKMLAGFSVGALHRTLRRRIYPALSAVLCILVGLVLNACGVCLVLLIGSLLDNTLGRLDLLETIRSIFRTFLNLGRSILNVIIP